MKLKNYIIKYIPWVLLFGVGILFFNQCNEEPIVEKVPIEIIVEVPVIEKQFDTIEKPVPIYSKETVIDSTYYEEWKKLKDSVARDSMFQQAIKIREYNEKFEDSIQTVEVYSKTRGVLLKQSLKYKTKPRQIVVKDTIDVPKRNKVSVGIEGGIPINLTESIKPVGKINLMLTTKKDNTWSISYDTEGRVWVGKTWKISLRGKNK